MKQRSLPVPPWILLAFNLLPIDKLDGRRHYASEAAALDGLEALAGARCHLVFLSAEILNRAVGRLHLHAIHLVGEQSPTQTGIAVLQLDADHPFADAGKDVDLGNGKV